MGDRETAPLLGGVGRAQTDPPPAVRTQESESRGRVYFFWTFTHYPHHLILNSVIDPNPKGVGGEVFFLDSHTIAPPPDFELSD